MLGMVYNFVGMPDEAIPLLTLARGLPNDGEDWFISKYFFLYYVMYKFWAIDAITLGSCYMLKEQVTEAIEIFEEALAVRPPPSNVFWKLNYFDS